jgi:hypothetical protein
LTKNAVVPLEFRGRRFSSADIELIQKIVATCGKLGRHELAATVAEVLEWVRPNGSLKIRESRDLLEMLADCKLVELPALRRTKPKGSRTRIPKTAHGSARAPIIGTVGQMSPISLQLVSIKEHRLLWRELVGRYHYLSHTVPFGANLRYLIRVAKPPGEVVGCVQLSSPAWRVEARDSWIGWNDRVREKNLQHVVNNSRFLILPWVTVRNLASAVLAKLAKEFVADWDNAYGVRPLLLETFVDQSRFRGTCYRAANWKWLGLTKGRGRMDCKKEKLGETPKIVFVYPLASNAREKLCT